MDYRRRWFKEQLVIMVYPLGLPGYPGTTYKYLVYIYNHDDFSGISSLLPPLPHELHVDHVASPMVTRGEILSVTGHTKHI